MLLIYSFSIKIYYFLILIVSPFNKKAKQFIKGRKFIYKNFNKKEGSKVYWFHCSSLGEFEQGRPLIDGLKEQNENAQIILSFYSPSGYTIRENYELADVVCYLPIDSKKNAKKFISHYNPDVAVFVKYEFWHHLINQLFVRKIPVYLVSAIFRKDQIFFKSYGYFFRNILSRFSTIFVQNESSFDLLKNLNLSNVELSGDTRFDRVLSIVSNPKKLPVVEKFKNGKALIICGSTWPDDEKLIANFMRQDHSELKFIIAPHEVNDAHIHAIEKLLNVSTIKLSEANEQNVESKKVLIVDSIGLLSSLYQFGDIAYIGGGFGVGIHNILEAATYGMPILFGPNYKKFQEAKDLIELGVASSINEQKELNSTFKQLLENKDLRKQRSLIASNYVRDKAGASEQILKRL